jgi:hypothetical protein
MRSVKKSEMPKSLSFKRPFGEFSPGMAHAYGKFVLKTRGHI